MVPFLLGFGSVAGIAGVVHARVGKVEKMLKPIFIGGCDRSGTTFLAASLARIPGVFALPESQFIAQAAELAATGNGNVAELCRFIASHPRYDAWREFGCAEPDTVAGGARSVREALDKLVRHYAEQSDFADPIAFVEHSPPNAGKAATLLRLFPDLRLIHILRDGRAVAASWMPLDWGPNDIIDSAKIWMHAVTQAQQGVATAGPSRATEIGYEALVEQGDEALRSLFPFLGLDLETSLAETPSFKLPASAQSTHKLVHSAADPSRAVRWREKLSEREIEIFEALAGGFLDALGYERVNSDTPRGPSLIERAYFKVQRRWRYRRNANRYKARYSRESAVTTS